MAQSTIAVVGLGYVGYPLAQAAAAHHKWQVIGVDINARTVGLINEGRSPLADERLEKALQEFSKSLRATTDFSEIRAASIVIIAVPTPVEDDKRPDLRLLKQACQDVAKHVRTGALVVIESTIYPGVCEDIVLPILEKYSGLKVGENLYLAHCPERINPGDPHWHVGNIPRVVGAYTPTGLRKAENFYREITSGQVLRVSSLRIAEMSKVLENSQRNIVIGFMNEFAIFCEAEGLDAKEVIEAASTKPFGFLKVYPGPGIGGHCIPVDPHFLVDLGEQDNTEFRLLKAAIGVNEYMPIHTARRVIQAFAALGIRPDQSTVAVLGLSYKPNIEDLRETPILDIIAELQCFGVNVRVFDPLVQMDRVPREVHDICVSTLEEAVAGAEGVIIGTGHNEFCDLADNPDFFIERGVRVVRDGPNLFNKEAYRESALIYSGTGR